MRIVMKLELEISPVDLDLTLGCGQTFRWGQDKGGTWSGILGEHVVSLRQKGSITEVEALPGGRGFEEHVLEFLRTKDDIAEIQRRLRKDPVLAIGMKRMKGMRIVKINEWECLISYILATYANIPRIMKMVDELAANYGRRIAPGRYAFPDHKQLSRATAKELAKLGLGYRAGYIEAVCERIDDQDILALSRMSYEDLRDELIELPGVGNKVADCVSLFGFGKLESFPIDLWVERALKRLYNQKGTYGRLRVFAADRFGEYAGYAQEYLYHNERMHARDLGCVFSEK